MRTISRHALLSALLAGALLPSCQLEPYELPAEELYTRSFIKQFGVIDKNQDWNLAERKSVTVNPGEAKEAKVYVHTRGEYRLVAHYKNLSGTTDIKFDAPKHADNLLVRVNNAEKMIRTGEIADFTKGLSSTEIGSVVSVSDDWHPIAFDVVQTLIKDVPEEQINISKVVPNFTFRSNGSFKFYYVFRNTNSNHKVYVYWYDEKGVEHTEQLFKTDRPNDFLRRVVKYAHADETYDYNTPYTNKIEDIISWDGSVRFDSKAITLNIPEGLHFGFYIETYDNGNLSHTYYSDANRNEPHIWKEYSDAKEDEKYVHASYKHIDGSEFKDGKTRTFIGFEDYDYKPDLNDVVLMFDPDSQNLPTIEVMKKPTEPEDKPMTWILATEDLGSTDDFDFNDLIVEIEDVATDETPRKVKVQALAAGGTLPIMLCYNGSPIPYGNANGGSMQFHDWFTGNPATTTMVNTNHPNAYPPKPAFEIEVASDFTMASLKEYDDASHRMGGFSACVERRDGTVYEDFITAPGLGEAPQMICVPGGWAWPIERKDIRDAYPKFKDWVSDHTLEWYKDEAGYYLTEYLVKAPQFNSGSTGDDDPQLPTPAGTEATLERIEDAWEYPQYKISISTDLLKVGSTLQFQCSDNQGVDVETYSGKSCNGKITRLYGNWVVEESQLQSMTQENNMYIFYLLDYKNNLEKIIVK